MLHRKYAVHFTLDLTQMAAAQLTDVAAWWGAGVATVVLLWDIYKWLMTGARLRLTVSGNMEGYGHIALLLNPNQTVVVVEIANVGDKKTTITHLFAYHYKNWWGRLFRQRAKTLVVQPDPALANPLPFALEPGARWLGATYQNQEVEELSRNGHLLIGVLHSVSKKPVFQRLVIPN